MDTPFDPAIAAWYRRMADEPTAVDTTIAGQRAHSRIVAERSRALLDDDRFPASERHEVLPGMPAVPVRVFEPVGAASATLVYFHGGGWIAGDLATHEQHARRLSAGIPARVVLVDYRRAPEHPFPAAFDDCLAATRAAAARYDGRLLVAGDSAGGQLAASVALACRDESIDLSGQLLIVPVIDLRGRYADPSINAHYPSRTALSEGYGLTLEGMARFTADYAADPSDWRGSPLLADLRGVAPAVIHTAGYDPLHDEGQAYAEALAAAGMPVVAHHWSSLNHGFFGLGGVSSAAESAAAQAVADLRALPRLLAAQARPADDSRGATAIDAGRRCGDATMGS